MSSTKQLASLARVIREDVDAIRTAPALVPTYDAAAGYVRGNLVRHGDPERTYIAAVDAPAEAPGEGLEWSLFSSGGGLAGISQPLPTTTIEDGAPAVDLDLDQYISHNGTVAYSVYQVDPSGVVTAVMHTASVLRVARVAAGTADVWVTVDTTGDPAGAVRFSVLLPVSCPAAADAPDVTLVAQEAAVAEGAGATFDLQNAGAPWESLAWTAFNDTADLEPRAVVPTDNGDGTYTLTDAQLGGAGLSTVAVTAHHANGDAADAADVLVGTFAGDLAVARGAAVHLPYATCRLFAGYAGAALRVRHVESGSEYDVPLGVTADAAALVAWAHDRAVEAGSPDRECRVVRWYSQHPDAPDFVAESVGTAPTLVGVGGEVRYDETGLLAPYAPLDRPCRLSAAVGDATGFAAMPANDFTMFLRAKADLVLGEDDADGAATAELPPGDLTAFGARDPQQTGSDFAGRGVQVHVTDVSVRLRTGDTTSTTVGSAEGAGNRGASVAVLVSDGSGANPPLIYQNRTLVATGTGDSSQATAQTTDLALFGDPNEANATSRDLVGAVALVFATSALSAADQQDVFDALNRITRSVAVSYDPAAVMATPTEEAYRLRDHLGTYVAADYDLTFADASFDGTGLTDDEVYRTYLNVAGRGHGWTAGKAEVLASSRFTLAGMEASGVLRVPGGIGSPASKRYNNGDVSAYVGGLGTADRPIPGVTWPQAGSAAAGLRGLCSTVAYLAHTLDDWRYNLYWAQSRFQGKALRPMLRALMESGHHWPADRVRDALRLAQRVMDAAVTRPPDFGTNNMGSECLESAGLAWELAQQYAMPSVAGSALAFATWFAEAPADRDVPSDEVWRGMYFAEGGEYDPSYHGYSAMHASDLVARVLPYLQGTGRHSAQAHPEWQGIVDKIVAMYGFESSLVEREPDGRLVSGSGYAGRTADGTEAALDADLGYPQLALAHYDDAFRVAARLRTEPVDRAAAEADIQAWLTKMNAGDGESGTQVYGAAGVYVDEEPAEARPRAVWSEEYPPSVFPDGIEQAHAARMAAADTGPVSAGGTADPLDLLPCERLVDQFSPLPDDDSPEFVRIEREAGNGRRWSAILDCKVSNGRYGGLYGGQTHHFHAGTTVLRTRHGKGGGGKPGDLWEEDTGRYALFDRIAAFGVQAVRRFDVVGGTGVGTGSAPAVGQTVVFGGTEDGDFVVGWSNRISGPPTAVIADSTAPDSPPAYDELGKYEWSAVSFDAGTGETTATVGAVVNGLPVEAGDLGVYVVTGIRQGPGCTRTVVGDPSIVGSYVEFTIPIGPSNKESVAGGNNTLPGELAGDGAITIRTTVEDDGLRWDVTVTAGAELQGTRRPADLVLQLPVYLGDTADPASVGTTVGVWDGAAYALLSPGGAATASATDPQIRLHRDWTGEGEPPLPVFLEVPAGCAVDLAEPYEPQYQNTERRRFAALHLRIAAAGDWQAQETLTAAMRVTDPGLVASSNSASFLNTPGFEFEAGEYAAFRAGVQFAGDSAGTVRAWVADSAGQGPPGSGIVAASATGVGDEWVAALKPTATTAFVVFEVTNGTGVVSEHEFGVAVRSDRTDDLHLTFDEAAGTNVETLGLTKITGAGVVETDGAGKAVVTTGDPTRFIAASGNPNGVVEVLGAQNPNSGGAGANFGPIVVKSDNTAAYVQWGVAGIARFTMEQSVNGNDDAVYDFGSISKTADADWRIVIQDNALVAEVVQGPETGLVVVPVLASPYGTLTRWGLGSNAAGGTFGSLRVRTW